MRERKYIKFRVDMLSDTKSKIIDRKPERDLIHYVWMALVLLAGKCNLEGELYLSKNIPYTIETLAIEFNRGIEEVKLALNVLIELEMVEVTENNIYKVKNFAKHQNIKVKAKNETEDKEVTISKPEVQVRKEVKAEISDNTINESEKQISENKGESIVNNNDDNFEKNYKDISKANVGIGKSDIDIDNKNMRSGGTDRNTQDNNSISMIGKKSKKSCKKKKYDNSIEVTDDNSIYSFTEGERPSGEDEKIIASFSF